MTKSEELFEILNDTESLVILCHYQPDPDCLASAAALQWLAEHAGVDQIEIGSQGRIRDKVTKSFINVFDIQLKLIHKVTIETDNCIARLDHPASKTESKFSDDISVDIVINTQELDKDYKAPFIDSRPEYGTLSTILTDYLCEVEQPPPPTVASALLFAIHHERLDHVRSPTLVDYQAAITLYPIADVDLIETVYGTSITPETLDAIGRAIHQRIQMSSVLVSNVGKRSERSAIPHAVDSLLRLDGVQTVLVMGIVDQYLELSARSFDPRIDVGANLEEAFGEFGSVGGQLDRGGGKLSLGIFADSDDPDKQLTEYLFTIVADRFFQTLNLEDS